MNKKESRDLFRSSILNRKKLTKFMIASTTKFKKNSNKFLMFLVSATTIGRALVLNCTKSMSQTNDTKTKREMKVIMKEEINIIRISIKMKSNNNKKNLLMIQDNI